MRRRIHRWAFALLLYLMEKTKPVTGSAENDDAATYVQWFTSNSTERPICVLQVSYRRARWRTVLSPRQALDVCEDTAAMIRRQMSELGDVEPQDFDTRNVVWRRIRD